MRAKFVYEALSDVLKPRPEEEVLQQIKNRAPNEVLVDAARVGAVKIVRWALEHGADVHGNVHADGDKALRIAVLYGHIEVVKVLLEAGADVHAYNDKALRFAAERGHVEVVKVLLEAGADVHAYDDWALRWAAGEGHVEVVKVLLKAGANAHANDDVALQWAADNGHVEVVKLLKSYNNELK